MTEHFFSGYCRCLDGSRMVEVVTEDGKLTECDCSYGDCKFQCQCTIAKEIRELNSDELCREGS